ncbi:hypothetical protein Ctob_003849 [Chrysochromulina tobinii]|uniref:Apple domain-containing protein n=1 Tax=Chrysochromulina tobinii TaxID=1460289 RepID=A0A0M0J9W9_9EUKA|nr:hypothetical protein Ctob_001878 [Chrysochromulina tobinii]KOO26645.1 hypothetical protein Ctob_003849 [Chrysochromulina tobinii]|eukprot:KOO23147.1 hypothetical protein Ctob_001878 [Chrysochromulina sp. CCMP291]
MFFTHTTMMMFAALVPSAAAAGNASDYVTVPGVFFPNSKSKTAGVVPSTSSMVFMAIPGVPLPEVPILWIGEANNADQVLLDDPSVPPTSSTTAIEWALADPGKTSFVHMYRCSETTVGTFVKGPAGTTFKKCPMNAASDTYRLIATYALPAFVCEQSCDKNPECTVYAVDKDQQNCYIGGPASVVPTGKNYSMYIRLPGI